MEVLSLRCSISLLFTSLVSFVHRVFTVLSAVSMAPSVTKMEISKTPHLGSSVTGRETVRLFPQEEVNERWQQLLYSQHPQQQDSGPGHCSGSDNVLFICC